MNRNTLIDKASDTDILIIGGGATGFACALDALSRGYKVALVDRGDFGEGTSSRSTKLIHGGVRYLRQGNLSLVRESLRERSWFLRAVPDLVHPLEFIIPCQSKWEQYYYRFGMGLYDMLAGKDRVENARMLSLHDVQKKVPGCASDKLCGGVSYADGQFDDARMIICFLRHVIQQGGVALNYTPVVELIKERSRVVGAVVEDEETGRSCNVKAKVVINATGPFTDGVCKMDEPDGRQRIAPSSGIHFVLDGSFLGGKSALMIPKTADGRVLFAIPWHNRVLYGTTDTPRPTAERDPRALDEETEYLIEHARHIFNRDVSESDILGTFTGLRPLPKPKKNAATSSVSRKFILEVSDSKLVTMYGGKWTSCRAMGEAAIDTAIQVGELTHTPSKTHELVLSAKNEPVSHLEKPSDEWVKYAVREEMARTLSDLLLRRSRIGRLNPKAALGCATECAIVMAKELRRDNAWVENELSGFRCQVSEPGHPEQR